MSEKTNVYEEKMKKSLAGFEKELTTIRVGRANPHVLDKILVDYYGTPTQIAQMSNITIPEARLLQIQPWESNQLKAIEKAIQSSDLGINPSNDGKVIRLVFPEIDEDKRKSISKDIKKKAEEIKVAIRNIRRDALDTFKKAEKKGEMPEDELKDLEDKIQKITDKKVEEADKIAEIKIKEVMSI